VDEASKHIVDELKRQGIYNKTMIIFTSDNGLMLGHHGLAGKWHPWEESIRVPLIIYDPRMPQEKRGTTDDSYTLNIDLAETILGAAGLKPSPYMQGRDIADLYLERRGNAQNVPWREDFYYEFPIDYPDSTALVTRKWKYVRYRGMKHQQLFDLENDPYELRDLMGSEEVKEKILPKLIERYNQVRAEAEYSEGIPIPACVKMSGLYP